MNNALGLIAHAKKKNQGGETEGEGREKSRRERKEKKTTVGV